MKISGRAKKGYSQPTRLDKSAQYQWTQAILPTKMIRRTDWKPGLILGNKEIFLPLWIEHFPLIVPCSYANIVHTHPRLKSGQPQFLLQMRSRYSTAFSFRLLTGSIIRLRTFSVSDMTFRQAPCGVIPISSAYLLM